MRYIQTFESYLEGGRSPLYHFIMGDIYNLNQIVKDDILKRGKSGADINLKRYGDVGYIPTISVTRNKDYSERGLIRLELDTDLLLIDGYKSYPIDEIGNAISRMKSTRFKGYTKYMNPFYGYKSVKHGDSIKINRIGDEGSEYTLEEEYEERFVKDIENLGKYIISIKMIRKIVLSDELVEYIDRYPHIVVLDNEDKIIYSIDKKIELPTLRSHS